MNWETFKPTGTRTRSATEPKVSIKNGKFSFNSKMRDDLLDISQEFVTLMFDKKSNKIGIQQKKVKDETTLKLSNALSTKSVFLNALAFFQHHGIDTSVTKSYPATKEKDIIVIDLNKAEEVKYTPRAGSASATTTETKTEDKQESKPEGQPTA